MLCKMLLTITQARISVESRSNLLRSFNFKLARLLLAHHKLLSIFTFWRRLTGIPSEVHAKVTYWSPAILVTLSSCSNYKAEYIQQMDGKGNFWLYAKIRRSPLLINKSNFEVFPSLPQRRCRRVLLIRILMGPRSVRRRASYCVLVFKNILWKCPIKTPYDDLMKVNMSAERQKQSIFG